MSVTPGVFPVPLTSRPRWVAVAPDGLRAYATLDDTGPGGTSLGGVAVIDTSARAVIATVEAGAGSPPPGGLVVSPRGDRVYVGNFDPSLRCGAVSVLDTSTNTIAAAIPLPGTSAPVGIAMSPDGKSLYVVTGDTATEDHGRLSVVQTDTHAVTTAATNIDSFPTSVALAPDGRNLYILSADGPVMIELATSTQSLLPDSPGDGRMAFTSDGSRAYVTDSGTSVISQLDTATNKITFEFDAPGGSIDVAVTPDGRFALVSQHLFEGARFPLIKIDTAAKTSSERPVTWNGSADGVAISPDGTKVYVADRQSRAVIVIPFSVL